MCTRPPQLTSTPEILTQPNCESFAPPSEPMFTPSSSEMKESSSPSNRTGPAHAVFLPFSTPCFTSKRGVWFFGDRSTAAMVV